MGLIRDEERRRRRQNNVVEYEEQPMLRETLMEDKEAITPDLNLFTEKNKLYKIKFQQGIYLLELKLLRKTVALAQLLSSRRGGRSDSTIRFQLLLTALLQVLRAIGEVERAIGETDRYIGLVKLLSSFNFLQASQLLQDPRWSLLVRQKVLQHQLRKYFGAWKGQGKLLSNAQWKAVNLGPSDVTLKRDSPLKDAFSKWRLSLKSKQLVNFRHIFKLRRFLYLWRRWTILGRIYRNYLNCHHPHMTSYLSFSRTSIHDYVRFAFREWRGAAKLQRRHICTIIQDKRLTFGMWKDLTQRRSGRLDLGGMYDAARNIRPTFCSWLGAFTRRTFCQEKAKDHHNRSVMDRFFDRWQDRRRHIARLGQSLGKWRGIAGFRRENVKIACQFKQRKSIVAIFAVWHGKTMRYSTANKMAEKMIDKHLFKKCRWFLSTWRRCLNWIVKNSEKMRILRAARDVYVYFHRWRQWRETRQAAGLLRRRTLLKKGFGKWQRRAELAHQDYHAKADTFSAWRRRLNTRRMVKLYTSRLSGTKIQLSSLDLLPVIRSFSIWHHRASLVLTSI